MTFEQKLPSAFRLLDNQFVCAEGSFLSAFSLVSLHLHHPIHIPLHRMHSLRTDECQCLAELVGVNCKVCSIKIGSLWKDLGEGLVTNLFTIEFIPMMFRLE